MAAHFSLRELPEPSKMQELAAPWAPYRSIGSYAMWRCAEAAAKGATPTKQKKAAAAAAKKK